MRLENGDLGCATYESVKDYYGKVLQTSKDLKTSACTAGVVIAHKLCSLLLRCLLIQCSINRLLFSSLFFSCLCTMVSGVGQIQDPGIQ